MSLLTSILQRQLVPSPLRRAFPVDFALESFVCHKDDEHLVQRRESDVPPFACRFSKTALGGHMLGIADEDGWVQILDSRKTGQRSIIKEWNAHENAVFDIAWMEGEQFLVTASGDQTVRLWDVSRDNCLAVYKGHSCSVKSVDFREDDMFVFATGARDGHVMVWDMRCNRRSGHFTQPIKIIFNAHADRSPGTPQTTKKKTRKSSTTKPLLSTGQQSVTAVLFQGGEKLISSGAVDGQIKIWDLRKTYTNLKHDPVPFHVFPYPGQGLRKHGFSSLVLDSTHSCLFAGCTNDNIYMYSCTALGQEPLGIFSGHLNSTFYVKAAVSPNDMYLISGSSDNDAYIWNVTDPSAAPILLKGHLGEVTSVAWCPSDQGTVVTCSDDNSFRIWRIDLQAHKGDKLNFVGESCRGTLPISCSPANDQITPSRLQDRTPGSSPSSSPSTKKTLWTPPTKLITNPRLNHISSPVGMVTSNPCSPNGTPPKKQNILIQSPKISNIPISLKTGSLTQGCPNKVNSPSPVASPVSVPPSPKSPVTQTTSPMTTAVPKFQSPTQLLTSWLRTNSRKRTHSDSDEKTDNTTQETESEAKSVLKLNATSEKTLTKSTLQYKENVLAASSQNNQMQELGTDDGKENYFNDQKSPALSPLRKRLCTYKLLHCTTSNNQKHEHAKPNMNPGKENCILNPNSSGETKEESDCRQTLKEPFSQSVTATSKCQMSAQTKPKNWLTQWSAYCKVKYGDKSVQLADKGGESNVTDARNAKNDVTEEESLPPAVQPSITQAEEDPKPGQSILTYFKPVSASRTVQKAALHCVKLPTILSKYGY